MMSMLSPDLLDRRALAWLRPVDVYGRTVTSPIPIHGNGLASVRKSDGSVAILEADGFADYSASFLTPSSPAVRSRHVRLDLKPGSAELSPRAFDLRLPRDPDPAKADQPDSLFSSIPIEMLPGPRARLVGSACALRVTVRRSSDKKLVGGALVRAQNENGQIASRGVTDPRGEATLIFPALPLAVAGAGANLIPDVQVRVVVSVDLSSASFNEPAPLARQIRPVPPFADPDELGSIAADFSSGTPVAIGAGRDLSLTIEWTQP